MMTPLALLNGTEKESLSSGDMFHSGGALFDWPILNPAMEKAILDVLARRAMSGTELTREFEDRFAAWHGGGYAIGHCNGTAALQCALYGVGLGAGDELICPSITFWASCASALALGAGIVFAEVDRDTLCLDPDDLEKRITPRTKAIMAVHYLGHPAPMDRIMAIARKHGLKVVEDCSHAHGARYRGRLVGTFGDAAGFSLMTAKGFAVGEGGILLTGNREVYERALLFGHYERHSELTIPELKAQAGLPLGGYKYRMHQMSSAIALEQLKKFPAEMAEVDRAMNCFWDALEGLPGIRSHRPTEPDSSKGAWFCPHGLYRAEELHGLSIGRFCAALRAEGVRIAAPGCNAPLHEHALFRSIDVYGSGRPTNFSANQSLPVSETIQDEIFYVPWFKRYEPETIARYSDVFRHVIEHHEALLPGDTDRRQTAGSWALSVRN